MTATQTTGPIPKEADRILRAWGLDPAKAPVTGYGEEGDTPYLEFRLTEGGV